MKICKDKEKKFISHEGIKILVEIFLEQMHIQRSKINNSLSGGALC
jgi:hypothetical protein